MRSRALVYLAAAGLTAVVAHPAAARPVRKAARPAHTAAAAPAHEALAEGACRYALTMGDQPVDEVKYLFESADMVLPRHGAVTQVVSFRTYRPDLPPTAPENERLAYARDVARFELAPQTGKKDAGTAAHWTQVRMAPGLPPGRETQVLGLPWISLPAPRTGLIWEHEETLAFPHMKDRFRYHVTGLTTVQGRRAWRVERTPAGDLKAPRTVAELKTPARVVKWQETFWVDAASGETLRAERRLELKTSDPLPSTLSLQVAWARTEARPLSVADYRSRVQFTEQMASLERQIVDASSRTTLDGASDLRELRHKVEDLRDSFPQPRYLPVFEKLNTAIELGLQNFDQRENSNRKQG